MSKFTLKETMLTIRGQSVRVRELTQSERTQVVNCITEDRYRSPGLIVTLGCLEPKFTEEEIANEPTEVVGAISDEIIQLSGLGKKEAKKD